MVGKVISHYKIIEKLGSGGMGIVYKAQDLKLDRFVALKFLPPNLTSSEEEKQRFIHEAKAASALQHNNICTIHEIDGTEEGQLFICMDYYEGETLKKKIEGEQLLPIDEILDIASQIANGLARAHESNITHRDLKPANIIITNRGEVKIVDFGLAKLAGQTRLTREGTTLGTIAYMSPEQARGDEVDHRTDIWSLGVILYEMLTGQLPFKGDYDQAVVYSIINDEIEPITGLRSGLPMELDGIITKCLQKSPADRYQHVDELVVDLRSLKKESESLSAPPTKKRSKTLIVSSAILSFLILAVAGYFFIYDRDKSEIADAGISKWENSIAVLPFDNISADPDQDYFCAGMTEQIISNLAKLPKLKVISRTSVMKYKDTDKTIPEIGKELNVAHVLEGSIRKFGDRIRVTAQLIETKDDFHIWIENYDREYKEFFDIQDDVSEKIATNLLATLTRQDKKQIKTKRAANTEAFEYHLKGKYFHLNRYFNTLNTDDFKTSELMLKKAIEFDPNYAPSYAELADLYNSRYNMVAKSEEEKDKYLKLQEKYINEGYKLEPNSADVLTVKGYIYVAKNEMENAYYSYKRAYSIQPNASGLNYAIGRFCNLRGLWELAVKHFSRSIELNPLSPASYSEHGICYIALGEIEKAKIDFQKALEIFPESRSALYLFAYVLIRQKEYDKAEIIMKKREERWPDSESNQCLKALLLAALGEEKKAIDIHLSPSDKFLLHRFLQNKEKCIEYLNDNFERYKQSECSLYDQFIKDPTYKFLHSDPRFQEILAKHKKLYEENLAKYGDIDI